MCLLIGPLTVEYPLSFQFGKIKEQIFIRAVIFPIFKRRFWKDKGPPTVRFVFDNLSFIVYSNILRTRVKKGVQ